MSAIKIRLAEAPAVITCSVATVLKAHGYFLARCVPVAPSQIEEVDAAQVERVMRELGRNAAQALTSIDLYSEPAVCTDGIPHPDGIQHHPECNDDRCGGSC